MPLTDQVREAVDLLQKRSSIGILAKNSIFGHARMLRMPITTANLVKVSCKVRMPEWANNKESTLFLQYKYLTWENKNKTIRF